MASQGVSRKRPAPGTSPMIHQQIAPADTQLSNDQFLQWGQSGPAHPNNTSASASASATDNHASSSYPAVSRPGDVDPSHASNQLTRRPGQQLVSRALLHDQNLVPLIDQNRTRADDQSGGSLGETEAELEQRALLAKKDAQAKRKQIPPFVQKLSSFLDESKNTDLIRWSDDGNSFIVLDEDEFAKTLIPELFKHNNYASFVRQLNMYGFHKKVGLSDNSLRASERKNKSPSEYSNPYFKRGHPDLLWLIQKPKSVGGQGGRGSAKGGLRVKNETEGDDGDGEDFGEEGGGGRDERTRFRGQLSIGAGEGALASDQLANVYRELQNIRQQQQIISGTISKLRREHEQLYGQAATFQEQHTRHENSINAILTFLATVYNRSLQGHEGVQGIINSFAGAIPQDNSQGNIVDMDNYMGINADLPGQRSFKKQPLLLKAPPVVGRDGQPIRASTMSASPASSYNQSQDHRRQSGQSSAPVSGNIEELYDTSSPQNAQGSAQHRQQQHPVQHQRTPSSQTTQDQNSPQYPQRDIMSVIQNSNARNSLQSGVTDFPTMLSSLETSGGNSPLTASQRADMLRLIANQSHASDPTTAASSNNALITPTPPPMPLNYPARLAGTRAEIDNLAKMQAEQDRSVQNLTNLLQPLSPTGSIPGLDADSMHSGVPPPPLDLDQIFNSGDYFSDFPDMDKGGDLPGFDQAGQTNNNENNDAGNTAANDTHGSDLFNFDGLPSATTGDIFSGSSAPGDPQHIPGYFDGYTNLNGGSNNSTSLDTTGLAGAAEGINFGASGRGGRITEAFSSSEATSPANTSVDENLGLDGGSNAVTGSANKRQKRKK
ncbi:stress-responsive transcription factor hsf1 [Onygenales sp. PD_10]|nr:stress-responsive transcription factor hsf1 [Onygenales sp. PD_10]